VPQPEAPKKATNSPDSMRSDSSLMTSTDPNRFETRSSSIELNAVSALVEFLDCL
jgi:hypothetical protein